MKFNEPVRPDDELVIDMETAEVRLNGQEVYNFSGSLFSLTPNGNTLTYSDSAASRNLDVSVAYTERDQ
jgi:hypothetical protein